jgi:hypothetical protein
MLPLLKTLHLGKNGLVLKPARAVQKLGVIEDQSESVTEKEKAL